MKIIQLNQIKEIIKSNSIIAIGGFTINRKPISIIKEIAGSDAKNLSLYILAGSLDVDLLVEKSKKVEIGTPLLKAEVTAKVLSHGKGDKVVILKYKAKKRESRKIGHRQPYTEVEITGIK